MECYRVQIPEGVKVWGVTATGDPSAVLPGEYLAHRLHLKHPANPQALLRFVGADAMGRDVHVPLDSVGDYLGDGAPVPTDQSSDTGR